jgi:hypothetical protein
LPVKPHDYYHTNYRKTRETHEIMRIISFTLLALGAAPVARGHTWIEQLRNVNQQGQYVGEYGYPRGMFSKTDPGFDGFVMNWQLPTNEEASNPFISANSMLCHPSQRKQQQGQFADKYPRLQATADGFLAMRYMENGHITKANIRAGKPENGGTVFVFGTTEPKEDEKLANVLEWTEDGTGGDGRGKILAMNDFDDGRCYERSEAPLSVERAQEFPNWVMGQDQQGQPGNAPLFCETDAKLPANLTTGKTYTLYWVWQWNTKPGGAAQGGDDGLPNGSSEYYTTCIDVDVVDSISTKDAKAEFALGQQDSMESAVKDFNHRTALMTNAMDGEYGPVFNGTPTPTGGASTKQPPAQTTLATSTKAPNNGGPIIVTVTQRITVTAGVPQKTSAPAAAQHKTKRAQHVALHGAKFRGRFPSE